MEEPQGYSANPALHRFKYKMENQNREGGKSDARRKGFANSMRPTPEGTDPISQLSSHFA
jgi:hypothetical protein